MLVFKGFSVFFNSFGLKQGKTNKQKIVDSTLENYPSK